jgi:hypothetical protein
VGRYVVGFASQFDMCVLWCCAVVRALWCVHAFFLAALVWCLFSSVAIGSQRVGDAGDYTGLTYHSRAQPERSRAVSAALVEATFAAPRVMRDLPALLSDSGWQLQSARGKCVSEVG